MKGAPMNIPAPTNDQTIATDELLAARHLAGLAMQALISRQGIPEADSAREEYALWSYRMAQAMLATEKRLHIAEPPEE